MWLAEGHGRDAWSRTALLCTLIANANRDPKKTRPFRVEDFNPYVSACGHARAGGREPAEVIEVTRDNIGLLKQAFIGKKGE